MKISKRTEAMQASPIRKLVPYADKAKKAGKKVYHLNIGQPDIKTPEVFFDAIAKFDNPVIAYSNSQGEKVMIESMVKYYKKHNMNFDYEDIIITQGGSEALIFAMFAVCDPGDEILVPEPFYTNYNGFASITGAKIVPITTKAEDGFHLPAKGEITKLINKKTKAILLANPGNPTGTVYNEAEINMIADIAHENNLFIIADEVYKEYVYDGEKFISFSSIEKVKYNVIITDSVSKRYSACGARVGSIASKNKEIIAGVMKLAQSRLCVATLEQVGAAALVDTPDEYMKDSYNEYKARRDVAYEALSKMEGVICKKPLGAFYVIVKLPIENAEDFALWMLTDFDLNNETVMFAPAEGFYATPGLGKDEVRLSFCIAVDDVKRAMEIFEAGLKEYKKTH
ncbi:MAG: pyridoxal phosphate-dependent aminotransferase [Tissierellia bacterium]|nr:pyridoxal phosphate-dependent aminotransferase [Tissierellia bacterium]